MTRPSTSNNAIVKGIVKALSDAGLVIPNREEAIANVISAALPPAGSFHFASDSEFLLASINHHVQTYFKQVLQPLASVHHSKHSTGRLLKDKEVEDAAVDLTAQVIAEVGEGYALHMSRYFGDEAGLTAYAFSRVHTLLVEEAVKYNDQYLQTLSRRGAMKALSEGT